MCILFFVTFYTVQVQTPVAALVLITFLSLGSKILWHFENKEHVIPP